MTGTLRCTLGPQAQYTHSTRYIQQTTSTHTKHFHNIQNNNHTQTYYELFHQTIHKHCQSCNTQDISINRATHTIPGYSITLTTTQIQEAIKQSENNNSQGHDKLNIMHINTYALLDSHSSRAC